jgi:hypothetical protein
MKKLFLCVVLVTFAAGCAGFPVQMSSPAVDSSKYEELGEGMGRATGLMLFGCIPINQNERFERAYNYAIKSKGGDKLLNPAISERWWYGVVINGYITTISGTVVKEK